MMTISKHSSVVIIESKKTKEFLLNQYDDSYRVKYWRRKVNLIGGNYSLNDSSPKDILERELIEEFSIDSNCEKNSFASIQDINLIRETILSNIKPYQDFFLDIPLTKDSPEIKALSSVFLSKIPNNIFDIIRENIKRNKKIKKEGLALICNLDNLIAGNPLTAWASGPIIEYYTKTPIPNYTRAFVKPIGKPRKYLRDYFSEFEYKL